MLTLSQLKEIIRKYNTGPKTEWLERFMLPPFIYNLQEFIAKLDTQTRRGYGDVILSPDDLFDLVDKLDLFNGDYNDPDAKVVALRNQVVAAINDQYIPEICKLLMLLRRINRLNRNEFKLVVEMSKDEECYIDVLWRCIDILNKQQLFYLKNYSQLTKQYQNILGIYAVFSLFEFVSLQPPSFQFFKQGNLEVVFDYANIFNDTRVRWLLEHFKANPDLFTPNVFKKMIECCKYSKGNEQTAIKSVCDYLQTLGDLKKLYQINFETKTNTAGIVTALQKENTGYENNFYLNTPAIKAVENNPTQIASAPQTQHIPPLARYLLYCQQKNNPTEENQANTLNQRLLRPSGY